MVLDAYTYVFALGSCFALLEAFNNGASMSLSLLTHVLHHTQLLRAPRTVTASRSVPLVPLLTMSPFPCLQTMSPTPGPPAFRRGP